MKNVFSVEELNTLDALEIRGGAIKNPDSPNAQEDCINTAAGCGSTTLQVRCVNKVTTCGGTAPIVTAGQCGTGIS